MLEVIAGLNAGKLRVCTPGENKWTVNEWVKKGVLLYFAVQGFSATEAGPLEFWDKIPIKKRSEMKDVRVVPGAVVRTGTFLEAGAILMPCFVNIGAYVATGSMIDTWATVGSCAQIGKRVHLSGGVGIGGVLEPAQAAPVIIEDGVFVGSRCIVVEGAHIGKEAVLGANVVITASTKILDVSGSETQEYQGYVPDRSVVIPGMREKTFPGGTYGVPVALIIGKRKVSTDEKVSLNDALRDFDVSV